MSRLRLYLLRLFVRNALILVGLAAAVVLMVQCLRVMEPSSLRGSNLGQLALQAALGIPGLVLVFLFLCIAIALATALRQLAASRELHVIHAGRRVSALWGAILTYALGGAALALVLAHLVVPATIHQASQIRAQLAAELLGRALVPNRFATVAKDVTITVGGRGANGQLRAFFADDARSASVRRTYVADTAVLTADDRGYVLQLYKGAMQYRTDKLQFSEISFDRYDMVLDNLINTRSSAERVEEVTSLEIFTRALAGVGPDRRDLQALVERTVEALRVIALCLFVASLASLPSSQRRRYNPPLELITLMVAFVERGISTYTSAGEMAPATGVMLLIGVSTVVIVVRTGILVAVPGRLARR
jgi:lipopolysaccharide export system permease protein